MQNVKKAFLSRKMVLSSIGDALLMLTPGIQWKNPVMFVTYIGAIVTTVVLIYESMHKAFSGFDLQITLWLWFTVIFANFAQAIAESRGKAQAASLRKTKVEAYARKIRNGIEVKTPSTELKKGDLIICQAGDVIPADGEVVEGVSTVDESAITGESAPVIRESGGDRSAVTAGTTLLSDKLTIRVTSEVGNSFIDRMINLIEGAKRQRTPNEVALHIVLSALTIIFLLTTASLKTFADYSGIAAHQDLSHLVTIPVLVSLLVCLIPPPSAVCLMLWGLPGWIGWSAAM